MATTLRGTGASSGVAIGPIAILEAHHRPEDREPVMAVEQALAQTAERFERMVGAAGEQGRDKEAEILEAYVELARDPALLKAIAKEQAAGKNPAAALLGGAEACALQLAALEDEYFAQRADDVRAVGRHAVKVLVGLAEEQAQALPERAVVCAHDLSPADMLHIDVARLGGIATEVGGPTSHTAIVARSLRIPAVVGVAGLLAAAASHEEAVLDGNVGQVVLSPDRAAADAAQEHQRELEERMQRYGAMRGRPVRLGERRVRVAANVGGLSDVDHARDVQADGIGLFRSEFLFSERDEAPDVEEQERAYRHAADAFDDPVVIRTIDVGGDKPIPYLDMPREDNPFLGIRGLRLCLQHTEVFHQQLQALCRSTSAGQLQVMFPMVATLADYRAALAALRQAAAELAVVPPPAGVMVETPAAVLMAPHIAREAAFLSIGTNDLAQYSAAADRTAAPLAAYQDPLQPHLLRLVAMTVDAAAPLGTPVAVCGEAAGDPLAALLLVGLGVSELSTSPSLIDEIRWTVDQVDPQRCEQAARRAIELPDVDAVRELAASIAP